MIVKNTANFSDQREVGKGRVHFEPILQVLGIDQGQSDTVLCGGFSYHDSRLKFSSIWLNDASQINLDGEKECSDGSKYLSGDEHILIEYCWKQYTKRGPHEVFRISPEIENAFL
ncbi:hypothetical protein Bhyg_08832 [Pseudolycoriella hygida]|uniref:Uncharacterized protein n=1 Tax=Pseudolycoriella hygida TaxID=35572 RepID=A0A9Q0N5D3_9DIPT|nr:hypothetical protein Bhyg_08832 [Pseudolycoriella hygida]